MVTKVISPANSFEGFDWKTFILGFKKPAIMLITAGIGMLAAYPEAGAIVTALGGMGVVVERIWAVVEFFLKEIKA